MACCNWGVGLPPPWQHAKYWAGNYEPHPDYEVWGSPVSGSIGCKASGYYGHVAWVNSVNGGSVNVHEQSCCEGSNCWPGCSWCINGFVDSNTNAGYFDGGYIVKKGSVNKCGDGACNNGENCSSCSQDCGGCQWCGDGACNNGENCSSCSGDCGACEWCGDGKCNNGENCSTCAGDCGGCCGNGACDYGENCSACSHDCGGCCPNGSCDFGETCATCEADCGICNDPPIGELQVATCALIAGWAKDTDVETPIDVRVLANGAIIHQMNASEPNQAAPGFGFSFKVPQEVKTGEEMTIEVIGEDDKDLADSAIAGSGKKIFCKTAVEQASIWTIEHVESAGLEIGTVAGDGGGCGGVRLAHPGGLSYPNAGVVHAFTDHGATPFEKVSASICGGFADPLYAASLSIEGQVLTALGAEVKECTSEEFVMPGRKIELQLMATSMTPDPQGRELVLKDLAAWSRGWRFSYSHDAAGLTWGNERVDKVSFASRGGASACVGKVFASREFSKPFHGAQLALTGSTSGGPVPVLSVGDATFPLSECPQSGPCKIDDVEGQTMALTLDCGGSSAIDGTWWKAADDIRVFGHFDMYAPPWTVKGAETWGLSGVVPESGEMGLAMRLTTEENDFFPYGTVEAEAAAPLPEFDQVRGMLKYNLPGDCFLAGFHVDNLAAKTILPGQKTGQLVLEQTGSQISMMLSLAADCPAEDEVAYVELFNASMRRKGWWTTPTPAYAGIRDLRGEPCSLTFENQKWWGNAGNAAYGKLLVHRFFADEMTGVRYKTASTFASELFSLQMLLDGEPVKTYSLAAAWSTDEAVESVHFTEAGFLFSVDKPEVYPSQWEVVLSEIEVQTAGGEWVSACGAAEGEPKLGGVTGPVLVDTPDVVSEVNETAGGDGEGVVEKAESGGSASGSCGVGTRPGAGWGWMVVVLLALALASALPRRAEVLRCSAGRLCRERGMDGLRAQDDGCGQGGR